MNEVLNLEYQQLVANAICHAADMAREDIRAATAAHTYPSVLFRPKLSLDGNQWCAMYGDNLQEGVCGFGESPQKAMDDFNKNWVTKISNEAQL